MTPDEQLEQWVKGNSIHNDARDECCPDFSCCKPELLAPKEVRQKFQKADKQTRMGMLSHFLSACVAKATEESGIKVHIAGDREQ